METELTIVRTRKSHIPPGLKIAEDDTGVPFFSRETDDMFVLSVLLKGLKKERVKVSQSKTKPQVSISGDKPVQEKVLRWGVPKKIERTSFRKVFWIPDGVDQLRAKFNEKEDILSIFMTKSIPGIQGIAIKEVKEGVAEAESSKKTTPVVTAEPAQTVQPKLKEPEITQGRDVVGETISKLPESKGNKISETTTPTNSKAPAKTVTDPKAEANKVIKAYPEEIQYQQPLPEDVFPADIVQLDSSQVSAKITADSDRRATEQMKAHPREIQHEQPLELPEDTTKADSTQSPAITTTNQETKATELVKASPQEIQDEQPKAVPEGITGTNHTPVSAKTNTNPVTEANQPMISHPEEIRKEQPVAHEDITKADSTQTPAITTTNQETKATELVKASPQEIQDEQPKAVPEGITGTDHTHVSAKTNINPVTEASQPMISHPEENRKEQPVAHEDITKAGNTQGPAKTTANPERGTIEPTKARSKEIQREQPSAVPEGITEVGSTQIPAIEPIKAHSEESQHEKPSASPDSTIEADTAQVPGKTTASAKSKVVEPMKARPEEKNTIQDQEVKEPWKGELDQKVQLKSHSDQPVNEMQNHDLQREGNGEEEEAEITVPAEQSRKKNETLDVGSTGSEYQINGGQTKDRELQKEEIHEKLSDIQEEQESDQSSISEGDVETQKEKESDRDGKSLLCNSCIFAGSAVIGILIVFVVQLMRKNNNSKKG